METNNNTIQKLFGGKKYDMREIYIGIIAKQSSVETYCEKGVCYGEIKKFSVWHFEKLDGIYQIDLFIKTPNGYKNILTDVEYQVASDNTPNKIVIMDKSLHPFGQFAPELMLGIKERIGYKINKEVVKMIQKSLNKKNTIKVHDEIKEI